jgi:hypothetical protein
MKASADDHFDFVFTWLETSRDVGWTTHIRPKEQPTSLEMRGVLTLFDYQHYAECIEFDFDDCFWRRVQRISRGSGPFDANNELVHGRFNSMATDFSPGIENLLAAKAKLKPFGMRIIPRSAQPAVAQPGDRSWSRNDRTSPTTPPATASRSTPLVVDDLEDFEVAISFAGAQRALAEELHSRLAAADVKTFYDHAYGAQL